MAIIQCEAIKTTINPWTIGGRAETRGQCKNESTYDVIQKSDNQKMTLCDDCLSVFKQRNLGDLSLFEFKKITKARG